MSLQLLSSAGMFPSKTVGAPGTQGAGVTGTHGMGVRTPNAAAVAAATVGFDGEEHIPNGATLTMGLPSMILAAGVPVSTRLAGSTTRLLGAAPKLHCIIAPIATWSAIPFSYRRAGGQGTGLPAWKQRRSFSLPSSE